MSSKNKTPFLFCADTFPEDVTIEASEAFNKNALNRTNINIKHLILSKVIFFRVIVDDNYILFRDVAQSGSALHWGCSGRRFKSGHPDH